MTTTPEPQAPEFSITRVFDVPRETLWRAWTEEAELAQWLRPLGVSAHSVSFDVRVGGKCPYTMTNDETGEEFPTGGTFLEIDSGERLVFTWGHPETPMQDASVITLTFLDNGSTAELVFHLRGFAGRPGDGFVCDGWDEALTNLGHHLAGELSS